MISNLNPHILSIINNYYQRNKIYCAIFNINGRKPIVKYRYFNHEEDCLKYLCTILKNIFERDCKIDDKISMTNYQSIMNTLANNKQVEFNRYHLQMLECDVE